MCRGRIQWWQSRTVSCHVQLFVLSIFIDNLTICVSFYLVSCPDDGIQIRCTVPWEFPAWRSWIPALASGPPPWGRQLISNPPQIKWQGKYKRVSEPSLGLKQKWCNIQYKKWLKIRFFSSWYDILLNPKPQIIIWNICNMRTHNYFAE